MRSLVDARFLDGGDGVFPELAALVVEGWDHTVNAAGRDAVPGAGVGESQRDAWRCRGQAVVAVANDANRVVRRRIVGDRPDIISNIRPIDINPLPFSGATECLDDAARFRGEEKCRSREIEIDRVCFGHASLLQVTCNKSKHKLGRDDREGKDPVALVRRFSFGPRSGNDSKTSLCQSGLNDALDASLG